MLSASGFLRVGIIFLIVFFVQNGQCDDCPSSCTEQFDPVCGSDGVTYSNRCLLQISQCLNPKLMKAANGEC